MLSAVPLDTSMSEIGCVWLNGAAPIDAGLNGETSIHFSPSHLHLFVPISTT